MGLLSDHAEAEPLCCFIDDLHWLDRASAQVLAFVGRRLRADPVGLLFACRARLPELAGFDELRVDGLAAPDAKRLLDSVLTTPLDARIRDRVIAEADGNPLALLELFRGSDEHIVFSPPEGGSLPQVGDQVRVLPAHVDPTVAYHERLYLVEGDRVLEAWPVDLRGW